MIRSAMSFACMLLVLGGCSTVQVSRDFDPDADFQTIRDWDWLPTQARTAGEGDALMDRRVRNAIESVLSAKGYSRASQDPDVLVTYRTRIEQDIDVDVFHNHFGYTFGPWWGGYGPMWEPHTVVTETEEAVILVDLIRPGQGQGQGEDQGQSQESRAGELIWRGIARYPRNERAEPAERSERVREAVTKLFERFPPMPASHETAAVAMRP